MTYLARGHSIALALTLVALPAFAQTHHGHDHGGPGPNGGRLEAAGPWHAELVAKGDTISVYLSEASGKPLPVSSFRGTAILVLAGKAARIPLEPAGDHLAGKSAEPLGKNPKGAIRLSGPGGTSASAKFD